MISFQGNFPTNEIALFSRICCCWFSCQVNQVTSQEIHSRIRSFAPVGSISLSHLFISRLGLFVIFLSTPSPAKDGTSAGVSRPLTKKLHRDIPKTRGLAKRNKKAAGDSVIFLGWAVWKRRSFYLMCFGAEGFFEKDGCLWVVLFPRIFFQIDAWMLFISWFFERIDCIPWDENHHGKTHHLGASRGDREFTCFCVFFISGFII